MKKWLIHDSRTKNIFETTILLNYIFCYSSKHFNTYSQNLRSYMLSHQIINSQTTHEIQLTTTPRDTVTIVK